MQQHNFVISSCHVCEIAIMRAYHLSLDGGAQASGCTVSSNICMKSNQFESEEELRPQDGSADAMGTHANGEDKYSIKYWRRYICGPTIADRCRHALAKIFSLYRCPAPSADSACALPLLRRGRALPSRRPSENHNQGLSPTLKVGQPLTAFDGSSLRMTEIRMGYL